MLSKYSSGLLILLGCLLGARAMAAGDPGTQIPYPKCFPFSFDCMDDQKGSWPGHWVESAYLNQFGTRNYFVYVPSTYRRGQGPIPLMVMLHGCNQDVDTFATESGMNLIAEQYGFMVLYPEQGYINNMMRCWNWFLPINQARGDGELSIVMGMLDQVRHDVPVDSSRIYVAGLSAGGAMASSLLACYSDVFAGGAIASGLEYRAAEDVQEGWDAGKGPHKDLRSTSEMAARCTGSGAAVENLMVIQGSEDPYINPLNADRIITQFTYMNDILDDGSSNGSETTNVVYSQAGQVPNGYPFTINYYGSTSGSVHLAKVLVQGMKHGWSGATKVDDFADPKGPPASLMIWKWLSTFTR